MPDTLTSPTKSPAAKPPSPAVHPDVRRHWKMAGLDPETGPTFQEPSEAEIERRIEESKRRVEESPLYSPAGQIDTSRKS